MQTLRNQKPRNANAKHCMTNAKLIIAKLTDPTVERVEALSQGFAGIGFQSSELRRAFANTRFRIVFVVSAHIGGGGFELVSPKPRPVTATAAAATAAVVAAAVAATGASAATAAVAAVNGSGSSYRSCSCRTGSMRICWYVCHHSKQN